MITSSQCWLQQRCNKYQTKEDCECKKEDVFCIKLFKINQLLDQALLSDKQKQRVSLYLDTEPEHDDEKAFDELEKIESSILEFVDAGKNLFIYSEQVGNGKTSWAVRLLQSYIEKIWARSDITCKALFINVPRFFLSLKDSISNQSDYIDHIKKYVLNADIVVWDEIATKTLTQFEFENLLSIVDARINKGKSNIYTSNLGGEKLESQIGDRLYSRIVNLSKVVHFVGKDKRCGEL